MSTSTICISSITAFLMFVNLLVNISPLPLMVAQMKELKTMGNHSFVEIPYTIKSYALKPFYKTTKCIQISSNGHNFEYIMDIVKDAMVFTTLILDNQLNITINKCNSVLITTSNPDEFNFSNNFKKQKLNIMILSFGTITSNNIFINKNYSEFGISNVLFVTIQNSNVHILSSPFLTKRTFTKTTMHLESGWTKSESAKPNLQGRNITVATFHCPLYTIIDDPKNPENVGGIEMYIARELSRQLNFTISLKLIEDVNKWGYHLKNGTWVKGIMGALSKGDAEFGFCSLWVASQQSLVVDFTPPWSKLYLTYLVPRPHTIGDEWRSILLPFQANLWLGVVVAVILMSIIHWKLSCIKFNTGLDDNAISFQSSTIGIIGVLSMSSSMAINNNNNRHLVSWWYIFALLTTTAFSSCIVSRLTFPIYEETIDRVEQLLDKNFYWGKFYGSSNISNILNMENTWHQQFAMKFKTVKSEEFPKLLKSNRFAVLAQRLENDYIFTEFTNITDDELDRLRVMKEYTNQYYIAISFRKNSPLYPICNRLIQILLEAGLVQYWIKDNIRRYGRNAILNVMVERDKTSRKGPVKLSLSNLQGAFYLLLFGHFLAILYFIFEKLNFNQKHD